MNIRKIIFFLFGLVILTFDTAILLPALLFVIVYGKGSYAIFDFIYSKIGETSIFSNIIDFFINGSNIFFWAFLISLFILLAVDVFQKLKQFWKYLVVWIILVGAITIRFWINFLQR